MVDALIGDNNAGSPSHLHLLQGRPTALILEGQHVLSRLVDQPGHAASRAQFPQHQAARVHVDAEEGVAVESNGALEYLWRHVAASAHLKLQ